MLLDVRDLDTRAAYRLLIGSVVPRAIAWVSTVSADGDVNLAPFSFFTAITASPPSLCFAPIRRAGVLKDTRANIEATGEFVVNAAVAPLAEQVNGSSRELPPGESEVEYVGLHTAPSVKVRPPRLAESPVNLECRVHQIVPIGSGPIAANLVIGEVLALHVADHVLDDRGRVDPRKLRTIARLGGDWYCHTSDLFEMSRPT